MYASVVAAASPPYPNLSLRLNNVRTTLLGNGKEKFDIFKHTPVWAVRLHSTVGKVGHLRSHTDVEDRVEELI